MRNMYQFLASLVLLSLATLVHVHGGSTSDDFISIDCGKSKPYNDEVTGINYVPDFQFIDTGETHRVSPNLLNSYSEGYNDLRSFPGGTRNCFNIKPVKEGQKYLVRAGFFHGNYDGSGTGGLPSFDLYLGVNYWEHVEINNGSVGLYKETIAIFTSNSMSVCLVNTGNGIPFVSVLEVRPLPSDFYKDVTVSQMLVLVLGRTNYGATSTSYLRDLSRNHLMGEVPDFLCDLRYLTYLNLGSNNLNGPIPKSLLDRSKEGSLLLSYDDSLPPSYPPPRRHLVVIIAVVSAIVFTAVAVAAAWFTVSKWIKSRACTAGRNADSTTSAAKPSTFLPRMMALHLDSKKFTFRDVVKMTKNFKKEIGKGGYGPVYHGIWKGNVQVAVKMLSHNSSQGPEEFQTEAGLLRRIHHRNLVPLVGYCCDGDHLALVYQFMAEGSLRDHLSGKMINARFHVLEERLRIALEAAQGLEYLHNGCTPAIIHRDVKTSNILLNEDLEAKIADFGFSKILPNDYINHVTTKVVGTDGYLDPEYYKTSMLNEKTDVYSFGIVLLELVTGLPAIVEAEGRRHIVLLVKPFFERGQIDAVVDERLRGDYDVNSVWKTVETALMCSSSASAARPAMSDVVILLKEALGLEIARRGDVISSSAAASVSGIYSTDSVNVMPAGAINVPSSR